MNKKQKSLTNKGFSLVELIIVIAIMAVLVGVLAPQFIKYVEQSRKSTDIQNAESIKTAVLADIADGKITASGTNVQFGNLNATSFAGDGSMATAITTAPTVQGSIGGKKAKGFFVTYDASAGTCSVSVTDDAGTTSYVLTEATTADSYKNAN